MMSGLFVETVSLPAAFCAGGFAAFINTSGQLQAARNAMTSNNGFDDHFMFLNVPSVASREGGSQSSPLNPQ
jgi:hypothetical protein